MQIYKEVNTVSTGVKSNRFSVPSVRGGHHIAGQRCILHQLRRVFAAVQEKSPFLDHRGINAVAQHKLFNGAGCKGAGGLFGLTGRKYVCGARVVHMIVKA